MAKCARVDADWFVWQWIWLHHSVLHIGQVSEFSFDLNLNFSDALKTEQSKDFDRISSNIHRHSLIFPFLHFLISIDLQITAKIPVSLWNKDCSSDNSQIQMLMLNYERAHQTKPNAKRGKSQQIRTAQINLSVNLYGINRLLHPLQAIYQAEKKIQ